jgi:predicted Fe-Mo cluster-binding NifX family protein
MKIGIALDGENVSAHFGHAPTFAIYTLSEAGLSREDVASPGHEPGKIPAFLKSHGVFHVIAGGMGPRAVDLFCEAGIEVTLGVSGSADDAVRKFLDGTLEGGDSMCHHH